MFYMVILRWPVSSSDDVGKVAVELLKTPLPDYLKKIGPYMSQTAEGTKSYAIYEAEKGHDEAYQFIVDYYSAYKGVEGFSITIEPLLTVEGALSILALKQ